MKKYLLQSKGVEKMTEQINNNKSIVLIGFMGVGKTTIAKHIAQNLNRPIIDIDVEIEKKFNMPTTEIFKQHGETFFRQQEKEITLHFCAKPNQIISLGGGAFLQEEIKNFCLAHNIVIFLDISWDYWKERLPKLIDKRPNLQNKSEEEIKQLFEARKTIYQNHHIKIITDYLDESTIANDVIEKLKLYYRNSN
jgi:shikimate kinase